MLKKVIPIALMLCLIFSINVMAENENPVSEEPIPETSEQIPQGAEEHPQSGRGNMGMPPSDDRQGMNRGQRPSGNFTSTQNIGEITSPQGEVTPPQNNDTNNNNEVTTPQDGNTPAENSQMPNGNHQFGGQMPAGMGGFPGNMQNFNGQTQEEMPKTFLGFVKTYSTPITSVILLALAFIFVIFYRRKNY